MIDKWTEREIEFLTKNHKAMSYAIIGERLGKSRSAVAGKAARLKLSKEHKPQMYIVKRAKPKLLSSRKPSRPLKKFADLERNECQYPYGLDDLSFCAKPVHKGAYCKRHHKLCHI